MRTIKCKRCGKILQVSKMSTYCDDCRREIKRESVLRERVCQNCGISFVGYPKSKYCRNCQLERNRISSRESQKRKAKGQARSVGQEYPCANCGKPFTLVSGTQIYCPECAVSASFAVIRAHKREYAMENIDAYREGKIRRHTNRKVCVICGRVFTSDIPTVTCGPECAAENIRRRQERYAQAKIQAHAKERENKKVRIAAQAEWVKGIRMNLQLTQKEAAKLIGVSKSTWNDWERGIYDISPQNRERLKQLEKQENHEN